LRFGIRAKVTAPFDGLLARFVVSALALIQPLNRGMRRYLGSLRYARLPSGLPSMSKPLFFPRLGWWGRPLRFSLWSEKGLVRDDLLSAIEHKWKDEGTLYSVGDGWRSWDLEMLSSVLWSIRVVTVTEYHAAEKNLTRVRLETRPNSLTSWIRFAVLLTAGLWWRFAELNEWGGLALLLLFMAPTVVRRMQLSGVKSQIKEIAQILGFKNLDT